MPILRAALETTWNPAYPNCRANMAPCSWSLSGTEHHILLPEAEPESAIDEAGAQYQLIVLIIIYKNLCDIILKKPKEGRWWKTLGEWGGLNTERKWVNDQARVSVRRVWPTKGYKKTLRQLLLSFRCFRLSPAFFSFSLSLPPSPYVTWWQDKPRPTIYTPKSKIEKKKNLRKESEFNWLCCNNMVLM